MSATPLHAFKLNPSIFNRSLYRQVYDLWFADLPREARTASQETLKRWYGRDDSFDNACKRSSLEALDSIGPSRLQLPPFQSYAADRMNALVLARPFAELEDIDGVSKENRAEASLSLVLMLDQFSRNIYRNDQAVIYSHYDRLARALVYCMLSPTVNVQYSNKFAGINLHHMFRVSPPHQLWFYMPLMHSEDLQDHDEYLKHIGAIRDQHPGDTEVAEYVGSSLNYEGRHRAIVEQFGRYPHRNAMLGRTSTPEEQQWLEKGGDTFGTG